MIIYILDRGSRVLKLLEEQREAQFLAKNSQLDLEAQRQYNYCMRRPRRWIEAHKTGRFTEWRLTEHGARMFGRILFLVGITFFGSSIIYSMVMCADNDCTVKNRESAREQRKEREQWIEQHLQQQQQQTQIREYQQQQQQQSNSK